MTTEPEFRPRWFLFPFYLLGFLVGVFVVLSQCVAILGHAVVDTIGAGADRITGDRKP